MPTELENTTIYQSADVIGWDPCVTINTSGLTFHNPWEDKLKEYCNSTDKHLDDLEEDIEFLDKMRKNTNTELGFHEDRMNGLESRIDLLKNENTLLRQYLGDLQVQINILQQQLDNQ